MKKTNKDPQKRGAKAKDYKDRKHPITVYITGDQIDNKGGIDKCRELALSTLTTKAVGLNN